MSEKDINRWQDTITPRDKAPQPWTIGSGGSWDMTQVQPIPDAMLAELAERYHYAGTPWNCRSMPLSAGDREYMYLLYSSMQGVVARMRAAEQDAERIAYLYSGTPTGSDALINAELRLLNGRPLTLAEARAAIDNAMQTPPVPTGLVP